jgi:outer membrane protein OmpA-like peptidoglycan-associated protein
MQALMVMLSLALAPSTARAQDDGSVDFELFHPAADNSGYFTVPGGRTLDHLELGTALWVNYANDPLVLEEGGERLAPLDDSDSDRGDGLVDSRLRSELHLGMGFTGFLSVNLALPVVLAQSGYDPKTLSGDRPSALASSGLGDLRFEPVFTPVSTNEGPVGVAFRLPVSVPTGRADALMGAGGATFTPGTVVELADGNVARRKHRLRAAVHGAYALRPTDRLHDLQLGNAFVYGAAAGVHPTEVVEFVGEVHGEIGGPQGSQSPGEALLGLHFYGGDTVDIRLGGGTGLFGGVGAPDWRVVAGISITPSFDPAARDADRDGISDDVDRCRDVPEDIDRFQDDDGCPDTDNDADGILDKFDECPDDSEDIDGFADKDGCPDKDNDDDGVPDISDRCPLAPETLNGHRDEDGCPDEPEYGDRDRDGYADDVDRCPQDPEDRDGFEDEDGCPDNDNDNDGILDADDRCPNRREVFNGVDDEDGCPEQGRVSVEGSAIKISERIYFETGRATIQTRSHSLLDEIAEVLQSNPKIKKVRVEGHTDNVGNEMTNLRLSQARADSVRKYLLSAGIPSQRLESRGFGEGYPLTSNDTPDGRASNRRVEFIIVDRD